MSKYLMTVNNETEAHVVLRRLNDAGIRGYPQGVVRLPQRDIYVEDADLDRARDLLKADEGISEDELIQAAEEDAAARGLTQPPPTQI